MSNPVKRKNIPSQLRKRRQWVGFRYKERPDKKPAKRPYNPKFPDRPAKTNDPTTWGAFREAYAAYRDGFFDGIGFVFTKDDPFVGIDFDNCIDPETGEIDADVQEILEELDSYTEISPSGKGLHSIVKADFAKGIRTDKCEIYGAKRFFTMTGNSIDDPPKPIAERSQVVKKLVDEIAAKRKPKPAIRRDIISEIIEGVHGNDVKLLWEGNKSNFPSLSEADLALCRRLVWLLGPNPTVIDAHFRESGLYRKKWDRQDYAEKTIQKAIESLKQETEKNQNTLGGDSDQKILLQIMDTVQILRGTMGDCFGTLKVGDHYETWPIFSGNMKHYFRIEYFSRTRKLLSSYQLTPVIEFLASKALFGQREEDVFVRLAFHEGRIYVDLCNDKWQVVEISPEGWRIINDPPVVFIRTKGSRPLPIPDKKGNIKLLFDFLNTPNKEDRILVTAFLIGAFRPGRPFSVLSLNGPQGSSKSTISRVLNALIDPRKPPIRRMPRNEHELHIFAQNGHLLALDNLSTIKKYQSDALCGISVGEGYGARGLYSDDEEKLFWNIKPIILNGIDMIGAGHDLIDRSLILYIPRIKDEDRIPEETFYAEFEKKAPAILGGIFDAVSIALRNLPDVKSKKLPRMADFAVWVQAAEPSLPWKEGEFMKYYDRNISSGAIRGIEGDAVAGAILKFAEDVGNWSGTSEELNEIIQKSAERVSGKRYISDKIVKSKTWPRQPNVFSKRIREALPFLEKCGVKVRFKKSGSRRIIKIRFVGE